MQNEDKNRLIRSTYIFNMFHTCKTCGILVRLTDYDSYKNFRVEIEESIKLRNKLLVSEMWKEKKVDKDIYQEYLKILN